jgi:hypothetical protein
VGEAAVKTVYVTKYALTRGIYKILAKVGDDHSSDRVIEQPYSIHGFFGLLGHDCFLTEGAAFEEAASMASRKIASLKKQIKLLEKLEKEPRRATC